MKTPRKTAGSRSLSGRVVKLDGVRRAAGWLGLQFVATMLNGLERGTVRDTELSTAWRAVRDQILIHVVPALFPKPVVPRPSLRPGASLLTGAWTEPSFRTAASNFNLLSERSTLRFALDSGAAPTARQRSSLDGALWLIWNAVLLERHADRLKRCEKCQGFFVDTMKNRLGRWCSRRCYDRTWNRPFRRLALKRRRRERRPRRGGPKGVRGSAGAETAMPTPLHA
jgi:hypothetical protein